MNNRRSVFSDEDPGGGTVAAAVGIDVNAVVVDVVDQGFCCSV